MKTKGKQLPPLTIVNEKSISPSFYSKALSAVKESMDTEFVLGVDAADTQIMAYSLAIKQDDQLTFILCKTMRNEIEFRKEVNNLSKYFNAEIIETKQS